MNSSAVYKPFGVRLRRNLIAGLLTAVVETAVFVLLVHWLSLHPVVANPVSFCVGVAVNYLLSRLYVFSKSSSRLHHEIIQFVLVSIIGLVGSTLAFIGIYAWLKRALLSKILTILVLSFLNFYLKQAIFTHHEVRRKIGHLRKMYSRLPLRWRLYALLRWYSCPVEAIVPAVPPTGRLLDIGCGIGLVSSWAALTAPKLRVSGVDVDTRKVSLARRATDHWSAGGTAPNFTVLKSGRLPKGPWSCILLVDVLYLLTPEERLTLLKWCKANIAADGKLIIKEMSAQPRWKYWWNICQETLSVKVLHITHNSGPLDFTPLESLQTELDTMGLVTSFIPLDKGSVHPHAMVVAGKR